MTIELLAQIGLHHGDSKRVVAQVKPRRGDEPLLAELLAVPVDLLVGKEIAGEVREVIRIQVELKKGAGLQFSPRHAPLLQQQERVGVLLPNDHRRMSEEFPLCEPLRAER